MRLLVLICVAVVTCLFSFAPPIEAGQRRQSPYLSRPAAVPEGLNAADWQNIRTIYQKQRRAAAPATFDSLFQQAYLKASNTDPEDLFAQAVAISGDTIVVGAPEEDSGATGVTATRPITVPRCPAQLMSLCALTVSGPNRLISRPPTPRPTTALHSP